MAHIVLPLRATAAAPGTPCLRVALLLGSARSTGWTRKLGQALLELAPADVRLEAIGIADLPLYHEELEVTAPPTWARFRAQLRGMDGLLFVTPEYNRSLPAALKNAIDIGSSPDDCSVWAGKPGAIVSFSPGAMGGFGANHHLRQSLVFLDVPVLQQPEMYLHSVERLFDAEGRLLAGAGRELIERFWLAFRAWLEPRRWVPPASGPAA
jgi:chromate reductase